MNKDFLMFITDKTDYNITKCMKLFFWKQYAGPAPTNIISDILTMTEICSDDIFLKHFREKVIGFFCSLITAAFSLASLLWRARIAFILLLRFYFSLELRLYGVSRFKFLRLIYIYRLFLQFYQAILHRIFHQTLLIMALYNLLIKICSVYMMNFHRWMIFNRWIKHKNVCQITWFQLCFRWFHLYSWGFLLSRSVLGFSFSSVSIWFIVCFLFKLIN